MRMRMAVTFALLACSEMQPQRAAEKSGSISVISVQSTHTVRMRLRIKNDSEVPLFVPHCDTDGAKSLCFFATHLVVHSDHGWEPAGLTVDRETLGGPPLTAAERVGPGDEIICDFQFAVDLFAIDATSRLRLLPHPR